MVGGSDDIYCILEVYNLSYLIKLQLKEQNSALEHIKAPKWSMMGQDQLNALRTSVVCSHLCYDDVMGSPFLRGTIFINFFSHNLYS